jgi:branched-chain amino acid transport system ATP-binding protein
MTMILLSVSNVGVSYDGARAVRDLSFHVDEGTIVGLIGTNGAGKSTVLRAISGLVMPDDGEIWYAGKRIDGRSTADRVAMGIAHVPEGRQLFQGLSVLENLRAGAYLRRDKDEIRGDIEKIIAHFPVLGQRQKQKAGTMSGGEQQLLAIARACMSRPRIILIDEPSLGLAPMMVREVGHIIQEINQQGTTILLVEQNVRLALRLSVRVCILEAGRLVLEGSPRELSNSDAVRKAYLGG